MNYKNLVFALPSFFSPICTPNRWEIPKKFGILCNSNKTTLFVENRKNGITSSFKYSEKEFKRI